MRKQEEQVEEVGKETKHKINREEGTNEHEFQRIKLKTNLKRHQSDNTDPEYSTTPHEPQVGVEQRITKRGEIQGESTLTSEVSSQNNFADVLDAEGVNVDNKSAVSSSSTGQNFHQL